jgi:predicted PurR-regulated permease PerM
VSHESSGVHPRRRSELLSAAGRFIRQWGFLLAIVFVIVTFREVLVPFIFAFALAYVMAPIIHRLQPRLGRALSVILVYLTLFGVVAVFMIVFLPALVKDFSRLRDTAPQAIEYVDQQFMPSVNKWFDENFSTLQQAAPIIAEPKSELIAKPIGDGSWSISLESVHLNVQETNSGFLLQAPSHHEETSLSDSIRKIAVTKGSEYSGQIAGYLRMLVSGVASFLTNFVITLMLAAFILINPGRVMNFVRGLMPLQYRGSYEELVRLLDVGLAGVIRGQLLICLVNGVLTYIGLMIFGIKYSFLLAVIAAAFSLVPIFGTIISSIPILLIALVSNEDGLAFGPPLLMLAWIAGIHLLEANIFNPKIIGDAAHMHPVVVIFALLTGEHMYGLTGALLAAPVASMLQTLFLFAFRRSRWHAPGSVPVEQLPEAPPEQSSASLSTGSLGR